MPSTALVDTLRKIVAQHEARAEMYECESARFLNMAMDYHKEVRKLQDDIARLEAEDIDLKYVRKYCPGAVLTQTPDSDTVAP